MNFYGTYYRISGDELFDLIRRSLELEALERDGLANHFSDEALNDVIAFAMDCDISKAEKYSIEDAARKIIQEEYVEI